MKGQKNPKTKNKNWFKKSKECSDWMVKLKKIINFIKNQEEKLEIKTIRTILENIIPLIWIEW